MIKMKKKIFDYKMKKTNCYNKKTIIKKITQILC